MERNKDMTVEPERPGIACRSATRIAVVAGAFSLTVAVLLAVNFSKSRPSNWAAPADTNPLYSEELADLKVRLAEQPGNEDLKEEIRAFDLHVRQGFFLRQDFSRRGKILLFAGLALFVIALKTAISLRPKPPLPGDGPIDPRVESQRKAAARFSVSVVGLCVAGSALGLFLLPRLDLEPPDRGARTADQPATVRTALPSAEEIARNWPRFRGPGGLGISSFDALPPGWDGADGAGIRWKTEVPLPGFNSPIVWDDRVFLSGATGMEQEVFCFHADSGELLWRSPVIVGAGQRDEELEIWEETGYAASTLACDNSRVYAIFATGDLACFDFDGKKVWDRSLGTPNNAYGFATSLLVHEGNLIVQFDQGGDDDDESILFAAEGATGQRVWQRIRPVANSWTTPIVVKNPGGDLLVTVSDPLVIVHDPATGREIWRADLMGADVAPSPVVSRGLVYAVAPNDAAYALRLDARGALTEEDTVWIIDENIPDICSPLCTEELIFLLTTMGTLACFETEKGAKLWEHDFGSEFNASPSLVGDRLFVADLDGRMFAVDAAREFAERGAGARGEAIFCTPAFARGRMYIRGEKHLVCFGKD